MNVIEPCPSMEELEAETKAHFNKEIEEHEERAKDLLNRLLGKGINATFSPQACYNSFGVEAFGTTFQQRHLSSRGWHLSLCDGPPPHIEKFFGKLDELLTYVENVHFPKKDWTIFDNAVDTRLQLVYQFADQLDYRVTIETRPEAGKLKVVVFVIKCHTDNVMHHGTFGKMSEAIASLEAFFKIK